MVIKHYYSRKNHLKLLEMFRSGFSMDRKQREPEPERERERDECSTLLQGR